MGIAMYNAVLDKVAAENVLTQLRVYAHQRIRELAARRGIDPARCEDLLDKRFAISRLDDGAWTIVVRRRTRDCSDVLHIARASNPDSPEKSLECYVRMVCYSIVTEQRRRASQARRVNLDENQASAEDDSESEITDEVENLLSKLPPHLRTIIWSYYGLGLTQVEAAKSVGCSRDVAQSRLDRGMKILRSVARTHV